jgi:hypothetical protein
MYPLRVFRKRNMSGILYSSVTVTRNRRNTGQPTPRATRVATLPRAVDPNLTVESSAFCIISNVTDICWGLPRHLGHGACIYNFSLIYSQAAVVTITRTSLALLLLPRNTDRKFPTLENPRAVVGGEAFRVSLLCAFSTPCAKDFQSHPTKQHDNAQVSTSPSRC